MKRLFYILFALWALTVPAHALDGDCDFVQGSTSVATGFTNCGDEIAEAQKRGAVATTSTNSGNDITSTSIPTGVATALRNGLQIIVDSPVTISGAANINYDGTGLKAVTSNANAAVGSGDMVSGTRYLLNYNTAGSGTWMIMNPLGSGFASASPAYVTIGNTASLTGERSLTAGTAIGLTDGGANSTITVAVNDVELTSVAGVTSAANKIPYYTGSGTASVADFSAEIRTAITTPSSANFRAWISDEVGTGAAMFGLISTMADDLGCTASQIVARNSGDTAFECITAAGGGNAQTANPLSQFAATTSAQFFGVISDETGGTLVVGSASPTFTGNPLAPTATIGDADTSIATTAFVDDKTEAFCVAAGDETTAITTGTAKTTFRMPYAFVVTAVRASLTTTSSSGLPTFDINEGGTTIISTKITIDVSELTSTTAVTPPVISDAALADDALMTIDFDVAGTGAAGPKLCLIGHQ